MTRPINEDVIIAFIFVCVSAWHKAKFVWFPITIFLTFSLIFASIVFQYWPPWSLLHSLFIFSLTRNAGQLLFFHRHTLVYGDARNSKYYRIFLYLGVCRESMRSLLPTTLLVLCFFFLIIIFVCVFSSIGGLCGCGFVGIFSFFFIFFLDLSPILSRSTEPWICLK